jgi:PKD repeat protein
MSSTAGIPSNGSAVFLSSDSSGLRAALQWLVANQSSNGAYGDYHEHYAAAAAYALWLNDTRSVASSLSYSYLASQLENSSTWFWGAYGEADIPGAVLFSIASSSNLGLISSTTNVASNMLQFQRSDGGFAGYYDLGAGQTVTSSVDTDMALLGLDTSNLISSKNQTAAINYLVSLQNLDGSFNLTSTKTYDPIYSLGPDPITITALTLLALKSTGTSTFQVSISNGLAFLNRSILANLCGRGHVYSAALSALVFKAYSLSYEAVAVMVYILSQQNADGGFSDASRFSSSSNALDTGWAAFALEQQFSIQGITPHLSNCAPVAAFIYSPNSLTTGATVQFNASTSGDFDGDQLSYNWTFGDGTSGQGITPTHSYTEAGNFTVTLTVTDSRSDPGPLSNTASQTIVVTQTTIQKSPGLSSTRGDLLILAGVGGLVGVVALAGAFFLGRRIGRGSMTRAV